MKVTITGTPKFRFPVSLQLVHALRKISKHHYDGECQRASSVAGSELLNPAKNRWEATTNGILTIWMQRFQFSSAKTSEGDTEVRATWDDLDLLAKIMEQAENTLGEEDPGLLLVQAFRGQVSRMMLHYNRYFSEWSAEVNV